MIKWFRSQPPSVKWMVILIIMFLLGVILRWGFVRSETTAVWKNMFPSKEQIKQQTEDKKEQRR